MHHVLLKELQWIPITLARRVRVMTESQIAQGWYGGNLRKTRRALEVLQAEELLSSFTDLVLEPLTFSFPLVSWTPYQGKAPNFSEVAYEGKKRFSGKPSRQKIFYATRTAINRFAGSAPGKPTQTNALNHDIGVSSLYLHFLSTEPSKARRFVGEDEWKEMGHCGHKQCVPDAVIRHRRDYRKNIMIELAGQYAPERLQHWHEQYQGFHYQIW